MEQNQVETLERTDWRGPVNWKSAGGSGMISGLVFLLATHGTPWFASGFITPAVMGRQLEMADATTPTEGFGIAALHLVVALVYAMIIAPMVHRIPFVPALGVGAALGLGLYAVNYLVMAVVMGYGTSGELVPLVTHIAFGMVAAGAYKGLARRQVVPAGSPYPEGP